MSTLVQLRTKLREALGNPPTTQVSDATLTSRLNDSVEFILDRYRFENNRNICTFVTDVGTQSYALPTSYQHLLSVWDITNKVRLVKRDDNWKAEHQVEETPLTSEYGPPTDYIHYKNWIDVWPIPDGEYTIRVRHKAAQDALSADGDEPVLPSSWHDGVWRYARYIHWDLAMDEGKKASAFDSWQRWLGDKPIEVDEELMADNEEGVILPGRSNRGNSNVPWLNRE